MTRTIAIAGILGAGWLGVGTWVVADLSTVKQSVEAVGKRHTATPVQVVGIATLDSHSCK